MKTALQLFFALLLAASLLSLTGRLTAQSDDASAGTLVEPGLRRQIGAQGQGAYFVLMAARADLAPAYTIADRTARGRFVYDALRQTARARQADLLRFLDERGATYRSFFIANALLVTSDLATLEAIAARDDVAAIHAPRTVQVTPATVAHASNLPPLVAHASRLRPAQPDQIRRSDFSRPAPPVVARTVSPRPAQPDSGLAASERTSSPFYNTVEWGVEQIGAPDIWDEFGARGQGIVVANMDTGVQYDHPALVAQYRGMATGSHDFNFYDPAGVCGAEPCDNVDLGTHTMGTMVGDDDGTNQIGVAPEAQWIAAKGCEGIFCSQADLLSSAEWLLAPCPFGLPPGDPSCDPAMRPHIVATAWGGSGGNPWFQASVDAWQAAGIVPIFPVGGGGPSPGTIASPADYCNAIGSGATSMADLVMSFSGRGPGNFSECEDKPDLVAPGEAIRSSIPGGYAFYSGTSMGTAHVAGCAALLLSLDPDQSYDALYTLLTTTALDIEAPGFDHAAGYGRVDCYAAASNIAASFSLSADPQQAYVCQPQEPLASFTIHVGAIGGFADPVTLSAAPNGTFNPNPVTPPDDSLLQVDTASLPAPGVVDVQVTGSAGALTETLPLAIHLYAARPSRPQLLWPPNGAVGAPLNPTFIWSDVDALPALAYDLAIADAPTPDAIFYVARDLTQTTISPDITLDPLTTYYWLVRATNACGWRLSQPSRFTTGP